MYTFSKNNVFTECPISVLCSQAQFMQHVIDIDHVFDKWSCLWEIHQVHLSEIYSILYWVSNIDII